MRRLEPRSNLYLGRHGELLTLSVEHRATASITAAAPTAEQELEALAAAVPAGRKVHDSTHAGRDPSSSRPTGADDAPDVTARGAGGCGLQPSHAVASETIAMARRVRGSTAEALDAATARSWLPLAPVFVSSLAMSAQATETDRSRHGSGERAARAPLPLRAEAAGSGRRGHDASRRSVRPRPMSDLTPPCRLTGDGGPAPAQAKHASVEVNDATRGRCGAMTMAARDIEPIAASTSGDGQLALDAEHLAR